MNGFKRKSLYAAVVAGLGVLAAGAKSAAAFVLDPLRQHYEANWCLYTTASTAQLGTGTQIQVSTGSPTTYIAVANCKNVAFMDGSNNVVDVTHFLSAAKEKRIGLPDNGKVTFEVSTDFGDAGQAALIAAKNARTRMEVKIILPSGTTPNVTLFGYCVKYNVNTAVDAEVKSSVEIEVDGATVLA